MIWKKLVALYALRKTSSRGMDRTFTFERFERHFVLQAASIGISRFQVAREGYGKSS